MLGYDTPRSLRAQRTAERPSTVSFQEKTGYKVETFAAMRTIGVLSAVVTDGVSLVNLG